MEHSTGAAAPGRAWAGRGEGFLVVWPFQPPSDLATSSSRKGERASSGPGRPARSWSGCCPVKARAALAPHFGAAQPGLSAFRRCPLGSLTGRVQAREGRWKMFPWPSPEQIPESFYRCQLLSPHPWPAPGLCEGLRLQGGGSWPQGISQDVWRAGMSAKVGRSLGQQ